MVTASSGFQLTIILESAVEHGFVGNPNEPGKTLFAANGYSLSKNDNAAGCVGIYYKFVWRYQIHQMGKDKIQ